MTEQEWLACTDPKLMLEFLRGKTSERKLRLFSIACDIAAGLESKYVDAFERHADGVATQEDEWLLGNDWTPAWESACLSLGYMCDHKYDCIVLRCIFGNPLCPPRLPDPACLKWNDATVVKVAQGIYEERAFDRLPVLADALEEAGCDSADILAHCRLPAEHVRGCWVVDLVLGKE